MTTLAKTELEQQIEELGTWAAGLELSAQDPTSPYWMRQQDAERAERIRGEQMKLIEQQEMQLQGFHQCGTEGCLNLIAGGDYCDRCEEEINGTPYPLCNILLSETLGQYITRIWHGIWRRKAEREAQS